VSEDDSLVDTFDCAHKILLVSTRSPDRLTVLER